MYSVAIQGASPSGAAWLVDGRDFLVPDDVRRLAVPVLAHRLLPTGASSSTGEAYEQAVAVLDEITGRLKVPV